jgi:hypothetical protein
VKLRRTLPALLAGVLVAVGLLAPASSSAYVVGIADQNPALFSNEHFLALRSKRTRLITAYDAALTRDGRRAVDEWMDAARGARQEIVVAFNPPAGMQCPNLNGAKGCRPVSSARYKKAFLAFKKRYPFVRIYQPWNEVNNLTQPTVYRPDAVVAYYDVVRRNCRGCTVLGADIQDLPNMVNYTRALLAEFRRRRIPTPQLWGMHNYTDTNRFVRAQNSSVSKLMRLVPGKIWLTETGGLHRFQPQNARQTFRPDLRRQARATEAVYKQANRFRSKVTRVYLYHFFGAVSWNRWDSGVLDVHGNPRPAYGVLQRYKRFFR